MWDSKFNNPWLITGQSLEWTSSEWEPMASMNNWFHHWMSQTIQKILLTLSQNLPSWYLNPGLHSRTIRSSLDLPLCNILSGIWRLLSYQPSIWTFTLLVISPMMVFIPDLWICIYAMLWPEADTIFKTECDSQNKMKVFPSGILLLCFCWYSLNIKTLYFQLYCHFIRLGIFILDDFNVFMCMPPRVALKWDRRQINLIK